MSRLTLDEAVAAGLIGVCHGCGERMTTSLVRGHLRKWCSPACRQRALRARRRRPDVEACPQCGAEVTQAATGRPRIYCSSQCQWKAAAARKAGA